MRKPVGPGTVSGVVIPTGSEAAVPVATVGGDSIVVGVGARAVGVGVVEVGAVGVGAVGVRATGVSDVGMRDTGEG